jgi:hypothetical protein
MNETLLVVAVFASTLAGVFAGAMMISLLDRKRGGEAPASPHGETGANSPVTGWSDPYQSEFEAEAEAWAHQQGRPEMASLLAEKMRTVRDISRSRGFHDDEGGFR